MKLRRHHRVLAALAIGTWLFALFAATAHACVPGNEHIARIACTAAGGDGGIAHSSGCEQFCHNDTPVAGTPQIVHDQPTVPPLFVSTTGESRVPGEMLTRCVLVPAHPSPDVPILLRFLRLAL